MRIAAWGVLALAVAACGPGENGTPDAGVDPSCGIDCASQERYGLIVNRCFEYASAQTGSDVALGALVLPVRELEGARPVIPVDYLQNGLRRMTDLFFFEDGDLMLARREFHPGSVTYRAPGTTDIAGVLWWDVGADVGRNFSRTVDAYVLPGASTEPTTYRVNVLEPSQAEITVPEGTYEDAKKLTFNPDPDANGADSRRVFVEDKGFTVIATALQASGGTAIEYELLRVRDVGDPAANACSIP